ncbi:MAG: CatB-related O-acetyltransferase [Methylobacterium mesophilicum]|nr:CatB-related O-acetyltransferase [Methylobacterium mesophilicum]
MNEGPSPLDPHPMQGQPRVGFLKPIISAPNIEIGDYTYYDDPEGPERFVERCVLYHYPFVGDRLVIGRFCAVGTGARFVMNGANHAMSGFSTYPFNIFGGGWEKGFDPESWARENRGDTMVGSDVWIGADAVILPGVQIGHGAIIGTQSVVASDVAPYAIVAGNPARMIRVRFSPDVVERLLAVAWWDWPASKITRNLDAIRGGDLELLEQAR